MPLKRQQCSASSFRTVPPTRQITTTIRSPVFSAAVPHSGVAPHPGTGVAINPLPGRLARCKAGAGRRDLGCGGNAGSGRLAGTRQGTHDRLPRASSRPLCSAGGLIPSDYLSTGPPRAPVREQAGHPRGVPPWSYRCGVYEVVSAPESRRSCQRQNFRSNLRNPEGC